MRTWMACLLLSLGCSLQMTAQNGVVGGAFDRKNTWSVLAEYANTSSHIIAGQARQRKLVTLGGGYTRRVVHFGGTEVGYRLELRPVVFESDPVSVIRTTYTGATQGTSTAAEATVKPCRPFSVVQVIQEPAPNPPETITSVATCGRQWTFGESFSPFGVRYDLAYRHRVQPYLIGTLGYMFTSRPVPVSNAEALNFVIDTGAGVELFRAGGRRSMSLEARVHHFSNRYTAQANPGTDNVVYGVSYSFGR